MERYVKIARNMYRYGDRSRKSKYLEIEENRG